MCLRIHGRFKRLEESQVVRATAAALLRLLMLWAHSGLHEGQLHLQDVGERSARPQTWGGSGKWMWNWGQFGGFCFLTEKVNSWCRPSALFQKLLALKGPSCFLIPIQNETFSGGHNISWEHAEMIYCILIVSVVLWLLCVPFRSDCEKQVALQKTLNS